MAALIPKFCPIHLKIHVCDEQDPINKNKVIDKDLNTKVRRLHGIKTEEDLAREARLAKPPKKGTLEWILQNAKNKNDKVKSNIKTYDDEESKGVDSEGINNRVAELKRRIAQKGDKLSIVDEPIDTTNIDKSKLTLQQVLKIAKQNNVNSDKNKEYVPPKRSNIQPKQTISKLAKEKTIYTSNSINVLERQIEIAKKDSPVKKKKIGNIKK